MNAINRLIGFSFVFFLSQTALGATIEKISVTTDGKESPSGSHNASISRDGRYIAFETAGSFDAADTNFEVDIYVRDRLLGETKRISIGSTGEEAHTSSKNAVISGNGRYVAFETSGSLVSDDTNNDSDVYVHDRQTGETKRISVTSSGEQVKTSSGSASISGNGRYICFEANGRFEASDTNNNSDIYVHDRQSGETRRISVTSSGVGLETSSHNASISADGRYVSFESNGSFESSDTNGDLDVYVHDRQTGETRRVSVTTSGGELRSSSRNSSISADGRYVVFDSYGNFEASDRNVDSDVYVHNMDTRETTRVSVASEGVEVGTGSDKGSISADGRYVTFETYGAFVDGDRNHDDDVYIHDRKTNKTTLVSVPYRDNMASFMSYNAIISGDASTVAFETYGDFNATDLNSNLDVYVRVLDKETEIVSSDAGASGGSLSASFIISWALFGIVVRRMRSL